MIEIVLTKTHNRQSNSINFSDLFYDDQDRTKLKCASAHLGVIKKWDLCMMHLIDTKKTLNDGDLIYDFITDEVVIYRSQNAINGYYSNKYGAIVATTDYGINVKYEDYLKSLIPYIKPTFLKFFCN